MGALMAFDLVITLILLLLISSPPMIGGTTTIATITTSTVTAVTVTTAVTSELTEITTQTTDFTPSSSNAQNTLPQIPTSVLTEASFSAALFSSSSSSSSTTPSQEPVEEETIVPVTAQTVQSSEETTVTPTTVAETTTPVYNKTTFTTIATTTDSELDEVQPYLQQYCDYASIPLSGIATVFLLTMILFAITKNVSKWGLMNLLDVRKAGVSFPQRPELIVLIFSTLPTIFFILARPLFLMSDRSKEYSRFINKSGIDQFRQFLDLFSRTAAVYHLLYWAYRMPIIRFLWRNYLRFNAFRAVWTKEHIIEVLRDKIAPEKDDKFRKMFQNSPESMYYYAQFLQSGLPMQYLQNLMRQQNRSPSMSTTAIDGFGTSLGGHARPGPGGAEGDVLPRVNLGHIMGTGTDDSASPKTQHYGNFLSPVGGSPSKLSNAALHTPSGGSHPISRGSSFRGSSSGRPQVPSMTFDGGFGQHLSPEDAANAMMLYERQDSMSPDMHSLTLPAAFSSQEMLFPGHGMIPGFDFFTQAEKKEKEAENIIKPPTREFVYICKHAIPGVIYALSFFITIPTMAAYDEGTTKFYFYYDTIVVVFIPMVVILAAFYHGVLAKTQLNGGSKMRFRLRCYYINFVILSIPLFCIMLTMISYRIKTDAIDRRNVFFANGIVVSLAAYHAQFVLKATIYTTSCNCICCSDKCLNRNPRLRNCIIVMVTPRNKSAAPPPKKKTDEEEEDEEVDKYEGTPETNANETTARDHFGQGTEIQIMPPEAENEPERQPLITATTS